MKKTESLSGWMPFFMERAELGRTSRRDQRQRNSSVAPRSSDRLSGITDQKLALADGRRCAGRVRHGAASRRPCECPAAVTRPRASSVATRRDATGPWSTRSAARCGALLLSGAAVWAVFWRVRLAWCERRRAGAHGGGGRRRARREDAAPGHEGQWGEHSPGKSGEIGPIQLHRGHLDLITSTA